MKKILSILLSVLMLFSALTVLTMLPAIATTTPESTGPVNLIVNGDGNGIDTDGDGTKDKTSYDDNDKAASTYVGEFDKGAPVGWRDLSEPYANTKLFYPHTFGHLPSGYYSNYSRTLSIGLNQGQTLVQDIVLEAGKNYQISAKIAANVVTKNTETGKTVSMFVDAKSKMEAASVPANVDWVTAKTFTFQATDYDYEEDGETVKTTYYSAGDFTDHQITFSADDFARANNLTAVDGKYNARLVFKSAIYASAYTLYDDVTMYEGYKISAEAGGYVNTDFVCANTSSTITATPYYGNTFLGWYDGDALVSTNATYTGVVTSDLTAKFNVYNLIDDGNFATSAIGDTAPLAMSNRVNAHATLLPQFEVVANNTGIEKFGSKILKYTSTAAANNSTNAQRDISIPVTVKKNTKYLFRFSMQSNHPIYTGFAVKTAVAWSNHATISNSFYVTRSATGGFYNSGYGYDSRTNIVVCDPNSDLRTFNAAMNKTTNPEAPDDIWYDVELIFDSLENEGTLYFVFGTKANSICTTTYFANMQISELTDTPANGKVINCENGKYTVTRADTALTEEIKYVTSAQATGLTYSDTVYTLADKGSTTITATANEDYVFDGWYDSEGNLLSTNVTENYFDVDFTAKFLSAPSAGDGGYLVDNGDGTLTAKAYFGNAFLGWYKNGAQVSANATVKAEDFMGAVATFKKYNLVDNGNMEDGEASVYNKDASTGSTEIKTEANGNKYLRMSSTTTDNSFYSFQWPFSLEQGKKYIISYDMRPGIENGNYLSSEDMSYRRLVVSKEGWHEINFTSKMAHTSGPKQTYSDTAVLLPSGGTDCYPKKESTSFADNFRFNNDEWVNYSIIIDTTTATANGVSIIEEDGTIALHLCFGANQGGTMVLDIDNVIVSECVDEYEKAQTTGGYATLSRRASTPVLPVVYTAYTNEGYKFVGWYDSENNLASTESVATFETAGKYTAKFERLFSVSNEETTEADVVIDTSAVDTDAYFIPYGALYYTDENGDVQFVDKAEDGSFTAPVAGKFNFTGFKKPASGKVLTFAASANPTEGTVQYGSYVERESMENGKQYGTMFITGDWDAFVNYYKETKGWTVNEIVAKVSAMYDGKIEDSTTGNVPISAGSEIVVFAYKVDQSNYMYRNEEGILEFALRVVGLDADRTCTAVGYAKSETACDFSENIITTSFNELVGNN